MYHTFINVLVYPPHRSIIFDRQYDRFLKGTHMKMYYSTKHKINYSLILGGGGIKVNPRFHKFGEITFN